MHAVSCSFDVLRWHAASTRLADEAAWRAWAQGTLAPADLPDVPPDVSFLPALQRRRLGLLSRLFFAAAWPLLDDAAHCPLVLVSHDGEINRGFELWSALYGTGDVSPTSFGLSVHNALAGQWSMARGDMSEHTALAADEEALEIGILEACGLLREGAEHVLLVFADEALGEQYDVRGVSRPPFAHALAMVLAAGERFRLTRQAPQAPENTPDWGALAFVRQHYLGHARWRQDYRRSSWHWEKTCGA